MKTCQTILILVRVKPGSRVSLLSTFLHYLGIVNYLFDYCHRKVFLAQQIEKCDVLPCVRKKDVH